jgi:hypothetical protein
MRAAPGNPYAVSWRFSWSLGGGRDFIALGYWVWKGKHGPFTFPIFFVNVLSPAIHQRKCSFDGA